MVCSLKGSCTVQVQRFISTSLHGQSHIPPAILCHGHVGGACCYLAAACVIACRFRKLPEEQQEELLRAMKQQQQQ
jgi:hypothetical protein